MSYQELQKNLATFLGGATRVAVLAVGSRLRGDDAAGMLAAAHLRRRLAKIRTARPEVRVYMGDTAPENMTGQIKEFQPSHLILIDAADTQRAPGHIDQVDPMSLSAELSASTHSLPIRMVIDFITRSAPCAVTIVGIQPATVQFGEPVSPTIRQATRELADLLTGALFPRTA